MLFSDGTSGKLRLERDAGSEPKVFLLGRPSREALLSAERGANAPYFALRRRGLIGRVCDFFEVAHDSDRALGVLGESTGLPFALAFAAYMPSSVSTSGCSQSASRPLGSRRRHHAR